MIGVGVGIVGILTGYQYFRLKLVPVLPCLVLVNACLNPAVEAAPYAVGRLWDTAIGLAIGMVVNMLIFPYDNSRKIRRTMEGLDRDLILFLEDLFDGDERLPEAEALARKVDALEGQLLLFSQQRLLLHRARQKRELQCLRSCEDIARELVVELEALRKLKDWDFQTEQRMMLDVTVQREGRQIYTNLGLNDAVIREGPISHVIHLKISSDGRHLADIAGDGVIVATPTGSTAYSLSAGGPVVEPVAQTMVVCPICTHNMRFSSYVLSPEHTLTIELERNGRKPVYLFVDESRAFSLKADDKVQVRRSKHTVKLVRLSERSFCEIFAQKMLPGGFEHEK